MSDDIERKARSEASCQKENIPINPSLPCVEDETNSKLRSLDEIGFRAMSLCVCAMKGEGMDREQVINIVEDLALGNALSPKKSAFIFGPQPPVQEFINFSWRYESYWVCFGLSVM